MLDNNIKRMNELTDILNKLPKDSTCLAVISAQYDYFMEFIGLYEDCKNILDEMAKLEYNRFVVRRYNKILDNYWYSKLEAPWKN